MKGMKFPTNGTNVSKERGAQGRTRTCDRADEKESEGPEMVTVSRQWQLTTSAALGYLWCPSAGALQGPGRFLPARHGHHQLNQVVVLMGELVAP